PGILTVTMLIVVISGFFICSFGLQSGVERVTKWMMVALLVIMVFLAFYSFTMPGAAEGLKFYLVPDMKQVKEIGLLNIITAAMNQSFFTLSLRSDERRVGTYYVTMWSQSKHVDYLLD